MSRDAPRRTRLYQAVPERTRTFRISTTGRVGPARWWLVRCYDDVETLRRHSAAYHPGVDFSECYGCCQTFDRVEDGVKRWGHNGYGGVIRYALPHLTSEIAAHELLHTAVATYRMTVHPDVRLGRGSANGRSNSPTCTASCTRRSRSATTRCWPGILTDVNGEVRDAVQALARRAFRRRPKDRSSHVPHVRPHPRLGQDAPAGVAPLRR